MGEKLAADCGVSGVCVSCVCGQEVGGGCNKRKLVTFIYKKKKSSFRILKFSVV